MTSIDLLNTSTSKGLLQFAEQFERCLTPLGRLNLMVVAFCIAPREAGLELAAAAMHDLTYGAPMVPFYSIADEAKFWASYASLVERKHYAAAIFNTFSDEEKAAFLVSVDRSGS